MGVLNYWNYRPDFYLMARQVSAARREGPQLPLLHITPPPILAGLERLHGGVLRGLVMGGGVPAWRAVTTPHVPAVTTDAQMHPSPAGAQTLLTAFGIGRRWRADDVMRAISHATPP
jgi:hypothetical protein